MVGYVILLFDKNWFYVLSIYLLNKGYRRSA